MKEWRGLHRGPAILIACSLIVLSACVGLWLDRTWLASSTLQPGWLLAYCVLAIAALTLALIWLRHRAGKHTREASSAPFSKRREAVLLLNVEGKITGSNVLASKLFGSARSSLVGKTLEQVVRGSRRESAADVNRLVPENALQRSSWRMRPDRELIGRKDNGSEFPAEISLTRLQLAGKPCLICFVRDVTERKLLEEQARQSQKLEAVGRLAAGVAHDFNNILTAVVGFSDLLLPQTQPGDTYHDGLMEIRKAGQRGVVLTRQLLAFGRKQVLAPVVLNLNSLILEMEKMLRRLIREDVALETQLDPQLRAVKVDPNQMTQILVNLILNARDAMPRGGRVVLRTANSIPSPRSLTNHPGLRDRDFALIEVSDNGMGMSEETKEHLFEPFFTTKAMGKGTGLGLATTYGIIQQSDGHVEVESTLGKGSTFRIFLPTVAELPIKETPSAIQRSRAAALPTGQTICLVEDEEAVRTLTRRVLELHGYRVLEAKDGEKARALCAGHADRIDLLVTDVVMPLLDGYHLARAVTATHPECRVIFMSGYSDTPPPEATVLQTDHAMIAKPFTPEELLDMVREVLHGEAASAIG